MLSCSKVDLSQESDSCTAGIFASYFLDQELTCILFLSFPANEFHTRRVKLKALSVMALNILRDSVLFGFSFVI